MSKQKELLDIMKKFYRSSSESEDGKPDINIDEAFTEGVNKFLGKSLPALDKKFSSPDEAIYETLKFLVGTNANTNNLSKSFEAMFTSNKTYEVNDKIKDTILDKFMLDKVKPKILDPYNVAVEFSQLIRDIADNLDNSQYSEEAIDKAEDITRNNAFVANPDYAQEDRILMQGLLELSETVAHTGMKILKDARSTLDFAKGGILLQTQVFMALIAHMRIIYQLTDLPVTRSQLVMCTNLASRMVHNQYFVFIGTLNSIFTDISEVSNRIVTTAVEGRVQEHFLDNVEEGFSEDTEEEEENIKEMFDKLTSKKEHTVH